MTTVLIFIVVLGLLVFVHELGHFVVARLCGIKVDEFGFGFPPRLWGIRRKDTVYSINWIPLGGFVRLHGEDKNERGPGTFLAQKAWKRTLVIVAGVTMNVVLAAFLFGIGFMRGLPADVGGGVPDGATVRNPQVQIVEVPEASPAAAAGLQVGDALLQLNGEVVSDIPSAQAAAKRAGEVAVPVVIRRGTVEQTLTVTLKKLEGYDRPGLGVSLANTGLVSFGFFRSLWEGVLTAGRSFGYIVVAFKDFFVNLLVHREVGADVAGPVGIAVLTGQVARLGFAYLLQFTALLSLNLALINVLPIPALDGGRLLFLLLEKLRGKPVSTLLEAKIHNAGFVILIGLIAIVTFRDILNLSAVQNFFQRLF